MKLEFDNIFNAIIDEPSIASAYQTRSDLMIVIQDLINLKGWEQKDVGVHLGLSQPRVSDLVNGRLEKFSIDKLMNYLFKVGYRFKPTLKNEKLTMSVQRVSVG